MKKIFNLSALAVAAMTIFSCSVKEENSPVQDQQRSLTFNVVNGGVDTKASLNASATAFEWEEGDKVGVFFYLNKTDANLACPVNVSASPAQITVTPTKSMGEDLLYAYYPYNSYEYGMKLEIPAEQNGLNIKDAMPMRAKTVEVENWEVEDNVPTLQFDNLAGVLEFNVYSTNATYCTEKLVSITFSSTSTVGGVYYPNYDTEAGLGTIDESYKTITASIPAVSQKVVGASKAAASNLVYMVVAEDIYTDATITVTTDKAIYTTTTPLEFAEGLEVNANSIVPFNVNLANAKFTREAVPNNKIIVFQSYSNKVVTDDDGNKWNGSVACTSSNQLPANFATTSANDRGACFGANATLISEQKFVEVSEIVVECSSNATGNKISVSVGGAEFTPSSQTLSNAPHQKLTFTNTTPASGAIEIGITRANKSIWIGGVILNPAVIPVESVSLDRTTAELPVGQTLTLAATINPNDAANKNVNWTSSATSVATVDENGVVTAVSVGETTITATTVDGGFTDQCVVTVTDAGTGGGETVTWIRCTTVAEIQAGGTFIIGYEATANNGKIIPMANSGSATTSAVGFMYSGASAASGKSDTIDMSSVETTTNYEVTIIASAEGKVAIKVGDNYLGNTNTKNNCKLFAADSNSNGTSLTVTVGTNDVFTFKNDNSQYHTLQYNTSSPRFAFYESTQKNLVVYKKTIN